jgi:hypothetical protein
VSPRRKEGSVSGAMDLQAVGQARSTGSACTRGP